MFPILLDAGGPFLLVFYGGAIAAAVLGVVGVACLGVWLARRARRPCQPDDLRDHEGHS